MEHIKLQNLTINIKDILGSADIFMWKFSNAPQELQDLSINGGDEDWLVILDKEMYERDYIGFLEEGLSPSIGCCCVDEFAIGKYIMLIGSHA